MADFTSDFLRTMHARGFIHQCTDEQGLDTRLQAGRIVAYIGFDCTAPSLHAGSLMQIMVLRWLQKAGHKPIILLGGGTTKVGDPSGKDEARKMLDEGGIDANLQGITKVFERYLKVGTGPSDAIIINNDEWLSKLHYIDFLRSYGKYFSVNRMLTQDSVKLRLEREQNLSFLEFNYMVLQAYDFVELNKRYGCTLQVGGSDQWGNIVMGLDLARRIESDGRFVPMEIDSEELQSARLHEVQPMIKSKRDNPDDFSGDAFMQHMNASGQQALYGLTTPLLSTASGAKMGKTANGAIWLDKDMLSPYDFWQYWRNTDDADVGKFLRLFTELSMEEIAKLEALKGADINEAKKVLAHEVTKLCHGERAAKQAAETAQKVFEQGGVGEDIPTYVLKASELGKGLPAYELFRKVDMVSSGGEARRLIRGGGAKINNEKISDENTLIDRSYFVDGTAKLSAGRKKHLQVEIRD